MDPDHLKRAWQEGAEQARLEVDAERLLAEVRRKERCFAVAIFWRDVREVGVSLLLVPLWIYLDVRHSAHWTSHLAIPAFLWIAGFMLVDRRRHGRRPPETDESLLRWVEHSLAQVEHQIWLLRNVGWWYLLPLAVAGLAFFCHGAWELQGGGWWTVLLFALPVGFAGGLFAFIYWLNQVAVRTELEPRRRELQALLASFGEPAPDASDPRA